MPLQGTLLPSGTISAAGNTPGFDIEGLAAGGASLLIAIETTATASFSAIFALDSLLPDGTWDQIFATAAITTNTVTNITIGPGGSAIAAGPTIRLRWSAVSGSATVAAFYEESA
jgi:hypothetical protein